MVLGIYSDITKAGKFMHILYLLGVGNLSLVRSRGPKTNFAGYYGRPY